MKNIRFLQSRAINEWGPIIKPLLPDFGPAFCQTIMEWCNIIPDNSDNYWEWFMIYDAYTPIGCCGVYSLTNERFPKELWLSWFGIIPEYRNKGIGKEALKFLEKWASSAAGYGHRSIAEHVAIHLAVENISSFSQKNVKIHSI